MDHRLSAADLLRPGVDYRRPAGGGDGLFDLVRDDVRGGRVLDYGCGEGRWRSRIEGLGARWVGFDLNAQGATVVADAARLPFEDGCFDGVLCSAVFEHLPDLDGSLAEIRRVLKPGGVLFGYTSFLEPLHGLSYFHMSHLGLQVLLERNGFAPRNVFAARTAPAFLTESIALPRPLPVASALARAAWQLGDRLSIEFHLLQRRLFGKKRPDRLSQDDYRCLLELRFAIGINFVAVRTEGDVASTAGYAALVVEGGVG